MSRSYEILHSAGADSVVIGDTASHDDIAEIFHNERHTVNQTVEQALETARLFAAAPKLLEALKTAAWLLNDISPDGLVLKKVNAAIAEATGAPA